MIYTELTRKAMKIAYEAHHGQNDKSGVPYVFHPYHLAERMEDEMAVCVALLHDVVEDTSVIFDELEKEFPQEVIDALKLLTHDEADTYFEYIAKIKVNSLATRVKLADLEHNSDAARLDGVSGISEERKASLQKRYAKAKKMLCEE